jgi:hypothetical protein
MYNFEGRFLVMIRISKYEIKSSYIRYIIAFLIYTLIASILMMGFRNYEIINTSSFIFGITAVGVIAFLEIFKKCNEDIYGIEGYLIFTPDEEGKNVLISKLIPDLIWMFTLALIMVSSIAVLIFNYSDLSYIKDARNFYEINKAYTIMYLVEYLLNIFRSVFVMYFSFCISKLPIWKRFSTIAGFGTYLLIEFLNLFPLLFLRDVAQYVKTTAGYYVLVKEYSINNLLKWYVMDIFIFILVLYASMRLLYNKRILK